MAGALAAAGQAPLALPWATLAGLGALLFLHLRAPGPAAAAWLGWGGGAGYFAASMFWIVEPFLVDVARHGWMAPFALVGLAGGLALFWA
ncbi:MAG: apolipoprotein N-acyltransferase, partial [Alphaproteobacteria bacterium]